MKYPTTPDGRYFVHHQRLWRCTNPELDEATRAALVKELMAARRQVKSAKASGDDTALRAARHAVDEAKIKLGERGPTWWDNAPDYNRSQVQKTPYSLWWSDWLG